MFKTAITSLGYCLIVAATALGQPKKVNLKDAGYLVGTVTESEGRYLIHTKFGVIPVPKDQVLSIEDYFTPQQEYQQRLAAIDRKKAEDHFQLGKWAFEKNLFDIASKELTKALELKADYEMASLLLRQVNARRQPIADGKLGVRPGDKAVPRLTTYKQIDRNWLLTDDEIGRIRIEELRPTDRVLVRFTNNVLSRFIEMMQGRHDFGYEGFAETFRGWSRVRQVDYMLESIGRERDDLRKDIVIRSDPSFMTDFRNRVWPVVANYCATPNCHGGATPVGGFRMFNIPGRTAKVDYTNFLLIDNYQQDGLKMIDRDFPDMSLLLHYGLPADQTEHPHPGRIATPYRNRESINYRRVMEWIGALEGPPHPKYDVELRVPWLQKARPKRSPTTQPAQTQPAGKTMPSP